MIKFNLKRSDYLQGAKWAFACFIGAITSFIFLYLFNKDAVDVLKEWQDLISGLITLGVGILAFCAVRNQIAQHEHDRTEDQDHAVILFGIWLSVYIQDMDNMFDKCDNFFVGTPNNHPIYKLKGLADAIDETFAQSHINFSDLLFRCSPKKAIEVLLILNVIHHFNGLIKEVTNTLRGTNIFAGDRAKYMLLKQNFLSFLPQARNFMAEHTHTNSTI